MSFLGSLAGGAVSNIVGGLINQHFSENAMDYQAAINERFYRNRYQWQREDLEKAGYNPIMAVTLGAGAGPSVGLSAGQGADVYSPFENAQTAKAAQRKEAEIKDVQKNVLKSQEFGNYIQAGKAISERNYTDYLAAKQKLDNEIREKTKDFVIKQAENDMANSAKRGQLIDAEIRAQDAIALNNAASAAYSNSASQNMDIKTKMDNMELQFYDDLYQIFGIPKSGMAGAASIGGKILGALLPKANKTTEFFGGD